MTDNIVTADTLASSHTCTQAAVTFDTQGQAIDVIVTMPLIAIYVIVRRRMYVKRPGYMQFTAVHQD